MSKNDYSLPGAVKLRLEQSSLQDIALSLQKQYESGLHQKDILICQDGELSVNPLIVQLLFPWLASRFSHAFTDSPQMILLPEYSQQEIKKQIDTIFSAAHHTERWLKLEKSANYDYSKTLDDDNLFMEDDFTQFDLKLENKSDAEEFVYDCDVDLDLDRPEIKKKRASKRRRERRHNVNQSPTEDATINPSDVFLPNTSEKPVFYVRETPIDFAGNMTGKRSEKRSAVWKFYFPASMSTATCISCDATLSTKKGSTKGLINHLNAYHPEQYHEFRSFVPKPKLPKLPGGKSARKSGQGDFDNSFGLDSDICRVCKGMIEPNEESPIKCFNDFCKLRYHNMCVPEDSRDGSWCVECCPMLKSENKSGVSKDDKKYRLCTECGKSVLNLAKHQKVHKGVRPDRQQCHICESTLSSANALKVHLETVHEGIRRYHCKFCNNNFIYTSHLRRHILVVHRNFKNPKAKCPDCGKQFKFNSAMRRHQRIIHQGQKQMKKYVCPECKEIFSKKALLNSHLREIHELDPPKRKPPKTRDLFVDTDSILKEYPDLLKAEDLQFENGVLKEDL